MPKKLVKVLIPVAAVVIAAIICLSSCIVTIPAGHTGVVTTFGRVSENALGPGMHLKTPMQRIIVMDSRSQKQTILTEAFSSDIQQVDVSCSIIYSVDKNGCRQLYESVGADYYSTVMMPRLMENIKAVFANYSAERLIAVRSDLSTQILEKLVPEMERQGITIISVSIENLDFSDAFTDAVEAKQVAEQTKLKVETEEAQQVSVSRSEAERRIIAANADAEEREILANADAAVVKINADAEAYAKLKQATAEAEANELLAKSITADLIQYRKIDRWDGALPRITSGDALALVDTALED